MEDSEKLKELLSGLNDESLKTIQNISDNAEMRREVTEIMVLICAEKLVNELPKPEYKGNYILPKLQNPELSFIFESIRKMDQEIKRLNKVIEEKDGK